MRKMRCLLSGLVILTMMVGMLGGCSSANPSKEKKAATSGSGAKVTLKVQLIGDFKQDDSTDPVSGETRKGVEYLEEEFEKQNQQIDLQYVIMGWDDYQKKTQSMMLAGEADVYQAPGIGALAEQDLLEPLQPYIDKDKFDLSVYIDGQVEGWKVVGVKDREAQIYGLPMIADTRFIVYDKQLFDEWGVPYLSSEPTLEEIMDAAKKTTGANPVSGTPNYGVTFAGKDAGDTVMNMNEYYGGTWGTGNKASELVMNFNTDTMIKAMDTMLELINYAPTGVMANQGAELFGSADNNIAINLRCNPAVITSINSLGLSERYAVARLFINDKEGMGVVCLQEVL